MESIKLAYVIQLRVNGPLFLKIAVRPYAQLCVRFKKWTTETINGNGNGNGNGFISDKFRTCSRIVRIFLI